MSAQPLALSETGFGGEFLGRDFLAALGAHPLDQDAAARRSDGDAVGRYVEHFAGRAGGLVEPGAVEDLQRLAGMGGPGAGRWVCAADQVVDVKGGFAPVDFGVFLCAPTLVVALVSSWTIFGALPALTKSTLSTMASTPSWKSFSK